MSRVEPITDGVWSVNLGIVNAFVLADDALTLIDTGTRARAGRLASVVREIADGRPLEHVVLTHHHPDHRGGLSEVRSEALTWAHALDASVIRGDSDPPGPSVGGVGKLALRALGPGTDLLMGKPVPSPVDHELSGGEEIPGTGGMCAVHTPGHTAGHVSYLHPGKRILFVGDAAQNRRKLAGPPSAYTEDMEIARRTLREIAELDFDIALFGHGAPIYGNAAVQFRRLADKLSS